MYGISLILGLSVLGCVYLGFLELMNGQSTVEEIKNSKIFNYLELPRLSHTSTIALLIIPYINVVVLIFLIFYNIFKNK